MDMYDKACAQTEPAPRSPFDAVNEAARAAKELLDMALSLRDRMIGQRPEEKASGTLSPVPSGILGTMESQADSISEAIYAAMGHLRSIEAKLP